MITSYKDEAADLITKHGKDAVNAMKRGIDSTLIKKLDDLGIDPSHYDELGIVGHESAEAVAEVFNKFNRLKLSTQLEEIDTIAKEIASEIDSIKTINGKRQIITKQGAIIGETPDLKIVFDNLVDLNFKNDISAVLDRVPELTGTTREKLLSVVQNGKFRSIIDELYRPTAKVGDGGTADAIRREYINGLSTHLQKGRDRLIQLKNMLKNESLNLNESDIADAIIKDLEDAVALYK